MQAHFLLSSALAGANTFSDACLLVIEDLGNSEAFASTTAHPRGRIMGAGGPRPQTAMLPVAKNSVKKLFT